MEKRFSNRFLLNAGIHSINYFQINQMSTTESTDLFPKLDLNEGPSLQPNIVDSECGLRDFQISSIGYVFDASVEAQTKDCRADEEESGRDNGEEELLQRDYTNINSFMSDFLLDSITVQFHTSVFWIQFFAHIFFPASYFLLNYKAQGFEIRYDFITTPAFYFNILFPSIIYLMIVTYFLCPSEEELAIRGALWVPTIFFVQHRMTIALKYASLSPSEYAKFQCLENNDTASRYMDQMQLLSGWATRDSTLLMFELGCAGARIGAKINEISIAITNPSVSECARKEYACWNALLRREATVKLHQRPAQELVRHADGSYTLSVYDISKAIIRKADASSAQQFRWVLFPFLGLMILLPWLSLLNRPRGVSGRSVYLYVFLACNFVSFAKYGTVGFLLLYVSVWDVSRQLHMVRYLHRLIRITDLTLDSSLAFRKGQRSKVALKRGSSTFSDDFQGNSNDNRKEAAQQRDREHLEEKIGVILSVTKSEKEKSLALRKSLSGHFSARTLATKRSDAIHLNHPKPAGMSTAPPSSSGSSPRSGKNPRQESVSARDIKSRFYEFGSRSLRDEDPSHIPQLSFKLPENIVGWTYARLVFQHFGERFRNRVDTYTDEKFLQIFLFLLFSSISMFAIPLIGGTVLLMLGLMAAQLLLVIIDPHPLAAFQTVFFQQSLVAVVLMWGILLVCCSLGALVNSQLNLHSRTFASHKLRLRDEIMVLSALQANNAAAPGRRLDLLDDTDAQDHAAEIEKLEECLVALDDCKDVIATYAELKPFSVFGFKIEGSTVFTVFSTGLSFFGVLFSLYSNASSGVAASS